MCILDDESLEDLQLNGLYIIQKNSGFRFGTDAVLLSAFAKVKKGALVADLCTGTGIIPILLSAKTSASRICGIEIIPPIADMAKRSVAYNKIDRIEIREGDIKCATEIYGCEVFDTVTCNPPYEKANGGMQSPDNFRAIARHEILCNLDDVTAQSAAILKYGGNLCMVHRADRIADVMCSMRSHGIEPKRLRLVCPRIGKEPNLILIEGIKGAGAAVKILPTLYIYDENGNQTYGINDLMKGSGA